jgi:hypothetical protein
MARPSCWPEDDPESSDDATTSWLAQAFDPAPPGWNPPKQRWLIGGTWIEFDGPSSPNAPCWMIGGRRLYF